MQSLFTYLHERLTGRSDHARFVGKDVDITGLTALELGRLWYQLHTALRDDSHLARALAVSVHEQARAMHLLPAFDGPAACDAMTLATPLHKGEALVILNAMVCDVPPELAPQLVRVMGEPASWPSNRYECYALARAAGYEVRQRFTAQMRQSYAEAHFTLRELTLLDELSWATVTTLALSKTSYFWASDTESAPDPATLLCTEQAYVDFARESLHAAALHLGAIHSGSVAYAADAAFALEDAHVLARAARVAAMRDEPWLGELMMNLLPKACVAPTGARTAPSQALAVALGHCVESVPTPETLAALREAVSVVRHAGVLKKLERNLKPAERALALRPDLMLRSDMFAVGGKREKAVLARCLEAAFIQQFALPWPQWQTQLAATSLGKSFARELVWCAASAGGMQAFMLDATGRPSSSEGVALDLGDDSRISLWHPAQAEADVSTWQTRLAAIQLRQPLRQVFREVYRAGTAGVDFAGHVVSLRALIGLARREGWRIDRHCLMRLFSAVKVELMIGATLYPGADGAGETTGIGLARRIGTEWEPVAAEDLDAVMLSEVCRAVDLLVSTGSYAIADDETERDRSARLQRLSTLPLGQMARMRANTLAMIFAQPVASGALRFSDRHAHVTGYRVHLATARATKDGEQIEVPLEPGGGKLVALPWLPYDEVLLEKLAATIGALLPAEG